MSDVNHEINLALRTAAGHMRAAHDAEAEGNKQYEMKMKSAGASMFAGFKLAILAAPEYQGRKIDDKRIAQIYDSTKPRPWWDAHLAKVKFEGKVLTREIATRAIQWHLDPEAARARKAMLVASDANYRKRLSKQKNSHGHGSYEPRRQETVSYREAQHSDRITEASTAKALAGRELPNREAEPITTMEDLLREYNRIGAALRKVKADERAAVLEVLVVAAREIESYIA